MKKVICIHAYVSGKVQGVWFRASTAKEAKNLNLTGWVQNLPDGRVEVLACGTPENVARLQAWLAKGPELANVAEVIAEEVSFESHDTFTIK